MLISNITKRFSSHVNRSIFYKKFYVFNENRISYGTRCHSSSNTSTNIKNGNISHEEAIKLLYENGLILEEKIFNVFRDCDPEDYYPLKDSFQDRDFESDSPDKDELNQFIADEWLYSALVVNTILTVSLNHVKHNSKILDIGCGTGYMTTLFAKLVGPCGHVIGIDVDPELIKMANQLLENKHSHLKKMIEFSVQNAFDLDPSRYNNTVFDVINVGGSLDFVPDDWTRLLNVNGCLISAFPDLHPDGENEGKYAKKLMKIIKHPNNTLESFDLMYVNYLDLKEDKSDSKSTC